MQGMPCLCGMHAVKGFCWQVSGPLLSQLRLLILALAVYRLLTEVQTFCYVLGASSAHPHHIRLRVQIALPVVSGCGFAKHPEVWTCDSTVCLALHS